MPAWSVASGFPIGAVSLAGTLPSNVTLSDSLAALGEVAQRSAFSSIGSSAAGDTASAGGAPRWAARRTFEKFAAEARTAFRQGNWKVTLAKAGAASHHLQDQYALGHILPGFDWIGSSNRVLAVPLAGLRGVLHQVTGGEVTFWASQRAATRDFFSEFVGRVI